MPRPFTRDQALQNAAFLKALRRTGNVREAARELGVHRSTFTKRRAKNEAFATEWDAALAIANAALNPPRAPLGEGDHPQGGGGAGAKRRGSPATTTRITRTKSGRLQLRRAQPARLTTETEQAFLAALSATANVRLSAAATGFTHSAFYHRRKTSPAFAREMRLALQMGYERLEMALLETIDPASHAHDAWRHNDPPPIPPMTANQALQLMYLHQKEVRLQAEPPHIKRRRGESSEAHSARLAAMYRARIERDREAFRIAEAERRTAGRPSPFGPQPPVLPALDQVTGWSKANPEKAPHDPTRALFGGWRLKEMKRRGK
jgi:hypothetical protein